MKNQYLTSRFALFFIALLLCGFAWALPARVIGFRASALIARSRVVFDLSAPAKYHVFTLKKPNRVVIDLVDTTLARSKIISSLSNSMIRSVRSGRHLGNILRVVIDLKQPATAHPFVLKADGPQPFRLVLDLKAVTHPIAIQTASPNTPKKPKIILTKQKKLRNVVVVIDPGHGGKDPGATGLRGTHEKNVVLAIGRDLQRMLDSQPGFKAYLTRTGDYFISLRGRLRIERRYHPDMFIAIHADAYKNNTARGASVFALSQNGATSEAARWLAQKENVSELGSTLSNLQYRSPELRSVLINLAQTASISSSLAIGDDIIHHLAKVTPLHHGFVEQAAFVVLKEPDVPSLLVESGFISNPVEEEQLRSNFHQQQIARALMLGITDYFRHHPPRDSYLSANSNLG